MRKMKDSGVEWIGEIPSHWYSSRIGNLFTFRSGDSLTSEQIEKEGLYLVYGANGIRGYYDSYNLTGQNILIGRVGALCGNVHLVDGKVWVTEHSLIAKMLTSKTASGYCKYLFEAMELGQYSKASAQPVIASEVIRKLKMPLPPISDQRTIADYLDNKCSRIDAIITSQEEIIIKLKEYISAIITETVTRGLDLEIEMKDSGIEWIEKYPTHWDGYRIANLYDQTSEAGIEELPILTVSINSGISDRELTDDEKDRVFVRSEDRTKYKRVRPGDLAYNMMRAWQGAFGAVRVDGMVSPAYVTCRPKPGVQIDSRYIEYLFRTPIATEEMHRYSHGIADFRLRLYWPEFKNIRLCLPPIEEQMEIADYIDEKTAKIEATIKKREETIAKLQEYKKSLIYEVVTGKKEVL